MNNTHLSNRKSIRPTRWTIRKGLDRLSRIIINSGGIAVIFSIVLIGIFLFYMVAPLFGNAKIQKGNTYHLQATGTPFFIASDNYLETGYAFTENGQVQFFDIQKGKNIKKAINLIPENNEKKIYSHTIVLRTEHSHAFGLQDGRFLLRNIEFDFSFINNNRKITPRLVAPLGENPIDTGLDSIPITKLALQISDNALYALIWQSTKLSFVRYTIQHNLLTDQKNLQLAQSTTLPSIGQQPVWLGVDQLADWAYYLTEDKLFGYKISSDTIEITETLTLPKDLGKVTSAQFLLGNISIIAGFSTGKIIQIFPVRDKQGNEQLTIIRTFPAIDGKVISIAPEYIRRGFAALTDNGQVAIYYSTNTHKIGTTQLPESVTNIEMGPRHNALLALDNKKFHVFSVENNHPEVSIKSLFKKIWYEFYPEPDYIWQSSSASNDFEPKFSLTPLTFGTLKAAFYAMLLAVPLAIMGAIYTAFFLSPALRQCIKPLIELMEAVPTVILGFIAGLWLAPFIEANLLFLFTFISLIIPLTIVFGYILHVIQTKKDNLPYWCNLLLSDQWRIIVIIPLILLFGIITLALQFPIEQLFFGGSMRNYLSNDLGIDFDQRNAVVIGIAMGFAVIPTIFSIAEDAIFSVPKQLVSGSLALGASKWQTLVGVVLPTASPGIFSAIMIGMGRAVGETMIVIMATGNTPIMDWNIFEGMRTLSANIAVEMPESEVGSSHYRILFLAGLLLFIFTFFVNTLAEIVRQNLRKRYGSI